MDERRSKIANDSRLASIALEKFREELNAERELIFKKLKTAARLKEHDLVTYASGLVAINALDDLENRLIKQVHAGHNLDKGAINGT